MNPSLIRYLTSVWMCADFSMAPTLPPQFFFFSRIQQLIVRMRTGFKYLDLLSRVAPLLVSPALTAEVVRIMTDLIATWYPVNSRPSIVSAFIPRRSASRGARILPPIIFIFADCQVATQVHFKLLANIRSSVLPALRNGWVEPVLTRATSVRVEIMQ